MARRFFYVCVGMFLLALSYHLGSTRAQAQSGGFLEAAAVRWTGAGIGVRASGVIGRTFYLMLDNGAQTVASQPIPGAQPIIATEPSGQVVMLADGQLLEYNGAGWNPLGNLLPGPVPALHESWGKLKARYR